MPHTLRAPAKRAFGFEAFVPAGGFVVAYAHLALQPAYRMAARWFLQLASFDRLRTSGCCKIDCGKAAAGAYVRRRSMPWASAT